MSRSEARNRPTTSPSRIHDAGVAAVREALFPIAKDLAGLLRDKTVFCRDLMPREAGRG